MCPGRNAGIYLGPHIPVDSADGEADDICGCKGGKVREKMTGEEKWVDSSIRAFWPGLLTALDIWPHLLSLRGWGPRTMTQAA